MPQTVLAPAAKDVGVRDNLPVLLAGLLGALWLGLIWHFGAYISPDSAQYMDTAVSLRYGHELAFLPQWPPLYPALLAGMLYLIPLPGDAASLLTGVCFLVYLLLFSKLLRLGGGPWWLRCLYVLLAAMLPGVLLIFACAWSEVVFAVLVLAGCYFISRHVQTGRTRDFVLAAGCAGLGLLTRYAGYALVLVLAGYAVWYVRTYRKVRLVQPSAYAGTLGLATLPGLLYITRNWLVFGTLHGQRQMALGSVGRNLGHLASVFWQDLYWPILLLFALAGILFARRRPVGPSTPSPSMVVLMYLLALIAVYVTAVLCSVSTVAIDELSTRYFSPIYPCALLAAWIALWSPVQPGARSRWMSLLSRHVHMSVCCLVVLAGLVHASDLLQLMRPFLPGGYPAVNHLYAGYRQSSSFAQLSTCLRQRLTEGRTVYASVIFDSMNGFDRPWLGRALFYRGLSLCPASSGPATFEDVHDGEFAFCMLGPSGKHRILFRDLPVDKNRPLRLTAQRAERLRQILRDDPKGRFLLIVTDDAMQRCGLQDLPEDFLHGLTLQSSQHMEGYYIYELALSDPSSQLSCR